MLLSNYSRCSVSAVSAVSLALWCLLLAPLTHASVEGAGLTAGPFQLQLQLDALVRYDDNIFTDESVEKGSVITELTPIFRLLKEDGVNSTSFGYALNAGFYTSSSDDNFYDSLFDAASHMEFSRRSRLDLLGEVLLAHEARGSEFSASDSDSIPEPDKYRTGRLAAEYSYGADSAQGRLVLGAEYLNKRYTNHRDLRAGSDRDYLDVTGTFYYRMMPNTHALFELKYRDIDYSNDPAEAVGKADTLDSTNTSFRMGLIWEATAKTTGTVKVGLAEKNFEDPDREDFSGFSWAVELQWTPQTYSEFDLATSRIAQETNGTGDFIDTSNLSLAWTHEWSEHLSSRVSTSLSSDEYSGSSQQDDLASVALKLDYLFHHNVSFNGGLNWNEMDSNAANQSYNQSVVFIGVEIAL